MAVIEKPFWQSWTIWANIVATVVFVLDRVLQLGLVTDPEVAALLLAVLNLLLRFKTKTGVTLS